MDINKMRVNQDVMTPVGRGVIEGQFSDGIVVVTVPVSGSTKDERCLTPYGDKRSVWRFPVADLQPAPAK